MSNNSNILNPPGSASSAAAVVAPKPPSLVMDQESHVPMPPAVPRRIPVQQPGRIRCKPAGVSTILLGPSGVNYLQETGKRFTILSSNLPVKIKPLPAGRDETYYA